jgi:hypothetical protein
MASNVESISDVDVLDKVLVVGLLQRFSHLNVLAVQILDVIGMNFSVHLFKTLR